MEHVRLPFAAHGRVSEAAAKPLAALSAATGISSTWLLVGALVFKKTQNKFVLYL